MHGLSTLIKNKAYGTPLKETTKMLPKNVGRPTSTIRKILLLAFVIVFWVFFYWYRGIEYSDKKPTTETTEKTPPEKLESLAQKKQP
jgi:hypothetical protein